jgi:hypothetical protein
LRSLMFSICAVAVLAAPARAATMEQVAVAAGQNEAHYNRVRFICLANGINMDAYEKSHSRDKDGAKLDAKLKAAYPDFYAAGAARGIQTANNILRDPEERERWCSFYNLSK